MRKNLLRKVVMPAMMMVLSISSVVSAKSLKAPPGMFKDLNDEIVGDAIIINGKQLFIDDYIVGELKGAEKVLNQPVKHPKNPLVVPDKPWEKGVTYGNGVVIHDVEEQIFKIWVAGRMYLTSKDGIVWEKPIINDQKRNNMISVTNIKGFHGGAAVFKDPVARDPNRLYKMLYIAKPDGTAKTLSTDAAYSPDGIHWTQEPANPIIPFSDTQICPYWDVQLGRYVAYLRYGPPNCRIISRIESEDFVHWSPKVTILWPAPTNESRNVKMDRPFNTKHYGMRVMPYEGVYVGLLTAYHGETIEKIPEDKLWMDKVNVQLAFSRNGLTWVRAGKHGAIPWREMDDNRDWKKAAKEVTFIPYGRHKKDWDWGEIYAYQRPLVVGDEIRIYYSGRASRHWGSYHGDPVPRRSGIGLATLRLDGFVSINAKKQGTMTTKPFVFIGDTLEVNANAAGGSIQVEALDPEGKMIEGFAKKDCTAITSDSVRHVLKWKGKSDCQLIQARPIKLRFYLKNAKLYSFTPRIRHKHYIQSYN